MIIFLKEVNFYVEVQITLESFLLLNKKSHESYERTRVTEPLRPFTRKRKSRGRVSRKSLRGKIERAFRKIDSRAETLREAYEKALIQASSA